MCGIAGILNFDGYVNQQLHHLDNMVNAMRHRGPDDSGMISVSNDYKVNTFFNEDTPQEVREYYPYAHHIQKGINYSTFLSLGHRRLSILDVSPTGHQPMVDSDKRFWIVHNGEIYNFQDIRKKLERLGHYFRSNSDTEVIIASYKEWGENCLQHFNGDFAFAIWDHNEKCIFCARDRIGIKPFYYTIQNNQFIFASDIKTIIASGLYKPEPDCQGLYLAMAFGIAPRPMTAFKGIQALEQGHWMRVGLNGRIEKQQYWNVPVGTVQKNMKEQDAVELLNDKLLKAVRRRLIADVPVGTFMSGGIDSTTISAMASIEQPGIMALTLAYEEGVEYMDELEQAKATGRMYPMDHVVHRVDPSESLNDLITWIDGYEEPFHNLAPNHVISKLASQNGLKVILNGLGGDELFAGYGYYRIARYWPMLKALSPLIKRLAPSFGRRGKRFAAAASAKSPDKLHTLLFQKSFDSDLHKLLNLPGILTIDSASFLQDLYAKGITFQDTVEAMNYMDLMNYIGNHHVHRVDQFTMAHSIEGRFPFLDHEVIEAAFRIPSSLKIQRQEQKYILRKVARNYIHSSCLNMKKKGFGLPLAQWMHGPLKTFVTQQLNALKEREIINSSYVDTMYNSYREGKMAPSRIWHLVALELWFQRFIDQTLDTIELSEIDL